ncbi:MAG: exopolyphosphatase, partial [Methyloprofundus sp.]|nr:exopolyphosphatase [Methyloprofundus sp.]
MIICSLKDGQLQTIDRLKEMVRLASGLNEKNILDKATQQRALACLKRFGQRIQNFP